MNKNVAERVRLEIAYDDMLEELERIVAGWQGIEDGLVRGRILTPWEIERKSFAKETIARAKAALK